MSLARVAAVLAFSVATVLSQQSHAQTVGPAPYQIYGSYSWLSNSFNGLPGHQQGLNGANAGLAFPSWHGLRPRIEVDYFTGTNYGAQQRAWAILGGGQYEHSIGHERIFATALFGDIAPNRYWGPNGGPGESASFTEKLGGGIDTPISQHLAIRAEADYLNENLAQIVAINNRYPYRVAGLPSNFVTFSTGLVWSPKAGITRNAAEVHPPFFNKTVEQELVAESLNSFGHIKIFANSWWSYLNTAGIEYDRHSWGYGLGARLDYVAEVLPVVIFRQPTKTDVYGNNKSGTEHSVNPGLGISPIGIRLLWNEHGAVKPFYELKAGVVGFTNKAIGNDAAYENFSLQQEVGAQFRITDRYGFRAGIEHFHFSDAFVVPSNPGIDEMVWTAGLSIRMNKATNQEN